VGLGLGEERACLMHCRLQANLQAPRHHQPFICPNLSSNLATQVGRQGTPPAGGCEGELLGCGADELRRAE